MGSKREKFASFGIATKGIVYFIIGALTALGAFGFGGEKAGSEDVLSFIADQSFGKVLLILLAIGLLGYVFWRWYQALGNPNDLDNDAKGIIKRVSYFISGALYGLLAYSALKVILNGSNQGGGGLKIFNSDYAATIAIIIGVIVIGKGIYEFYQAYSGKFKEDVENAQLDQKASSFLMKAGKFGFTARGVIAAILGILFVKAGVSGNAERLGKTDAFSFIQEEFGATVMGVVALGLVGYGVFMIIKAKYSSLSVKSSN